MKYIDTKLNKIATDYYSVYNNSFKDFNHFRDSLEKVYALIANRTARSYNKTFGIGSEHLYTELWALPFNEISSNDFKELFERFRSNGVKRRVEYSILLNILSNEQIIVQNKHYSNKLKFTKSYSLHTEFLNDCIQEYLRTYIANTKKRQFNIYEATNGYYPNRLLERKIKEAKKLYDENTVIDNMYIKLPDNWDEQISLFGWCYFDSDLYIDDIIDGLKRFKEHKTIGYVYGRYYDWFTSCTSAFRHYIYIGNNHYRELVDCHSGMFWMFAIYGYRLGKISKDETLKMIEHCFSGTFYTDVSGEKIKTKELKAKFMKIANMHNGQLCFLCNNDETAKTIYSNMKVLYPEWINFIDELRNLHKSEIGQKNHEAITNIEREIMDELKDLLEREYNVKNSLRVHDALYTLNDIDDIDDILYGLVIEKYV